MSVEILKDIHSGYQTLICNTTMIAFGNVFYRNENVCEFLDQLKLDARLYTQTELSEEISNWRSKQE